MDRYPHKILIQSVIGEVSPYKSPTYTNVFEGRCRCFMDKRSSNGDDLSENNYQVVIPSPKMVDIGENFKVSVKMHNTINGKEWDLVGYVKDFARYDRVCNLYFQEIKDLQIQEDNHQ